jgi:hypothetical protein
MMATPNAIAIERRAKEKREEKERREERREKKEIPKHEPFLFVILSLSPLQF